jgi:hypothetical protein
MSPNLPRGHTLQETRGGPNPGNAMHYDFKLVSYTITITPSKLPK